MKVYGVIKQIRAVVGLVFGLLFFISIPTFFVYDHFVNEPKAALMQQELEQEFKVIKPLPQAFTCDYHASHKTQQASAAGHYSTNLSFQEVRAYYDSELPKHGWRFHKEEKNYDWGRDFGGRSVYYCKGNFKASLEYAGENSGDPHGYSLYLSWGLESLNDQWSGDVCK